MSLPAQQWHYRDRTKPKVATMPYIHLSNYFKGGKSKITILFCKAKMQQLYFFSYYLLFILFYYYSLFGCTTLSLNSPQKYIAWLPITHVCDTGGNLPVTLKKINLTMQETAFNDVFCQYCLHATASPHFTRSE